MGIVGLKDMRPIDQANQSLMNVTVIYKNETKTVLIEPFATLDEVLEKVVLDEDVDERKINRQKVVTHRDVITIPTLTEIEPISINTATALELQVLTGVGPKMASDIVAYREEHGNFQMLEDLMLVKGMGVKKFEKIKDDICL